MKKCVLFLMILLTCNHIEAERYDIYHIDLSITIGQLQKIQIPFNNSNSRCESFEHYNSSAAYAYHRVEGNKPYLYIYGVNRGASVIDIESSHKDERFIYSVKVIDVAAITLPNNLFLCQGDSYTYNPIIRDVGINTTLTWNSLNPEVATVAEDGTVTAVGKGIATILCTAPNGVTAQSLVIVSKNSSVSSVNRNGDVNGDSIVDVADIATIISIMASQAQKTSDIEE